MSRSDVLQALALDGCLCTREEARTMTRTLFTLTIAAAAALAGGSKTDQSTSDADNAAANNMASAAPIELPPSIVASKIYRCKDNSVLYIDWLSDNKSANVRTERNGTPPPVDTSA
jgi:hypothetical protein